ncbi:MAG: putative peptidoglycan hydrolase [Prokaryotic dsDNA virus sp.]|nr:MAG: putative peptidoglycan hydrolase [Prokaryotic dsDNA virus sp.]|tara:strand:+ start:18475 stop:19203 length:729 start_codon:yes stop_codon:yes gene_type:complete
MPNKIDIVNGTYSLIRISGLTSSPLPEEINTAIQVLDDLAAEISTSLNLGYIQPIEYGASGPNDDSGLSPELAGPMKKMLAVELVTFFGREVTPTLAAIAKSGMKSMERLLVSVPDMQNPATLPIGSGNEWDYRSDKFYPEPNNDDGAIDHFKDDVFQFPFDWSSWVGETDTLISVTYDADSGINLSNEAIEGNTSVVTISFNSVGQFALCMVAEKSDGEKKTVRSLYNSKSCKSTGLYYSS